MMNIDPDEMGLMSEVLSRVLDDAGASWDMMMWIRRIRLLGEAGGTILLKLKGINATLYNFGSQTEGTTTIGLDSDIDNLTFNEDANVMQVPTDWKTGKRNLLLIKSGITSPQHCLLQVFKDDISGPITEVFNKDLVRDNHGRVLLRTLIDTAIKELATCIDKAVIRKGPSRSFFDQADLVGGFRLTNLPSQCQRWLNKPRPGHWPTQNMLREAKDLGCFLVPVGSPDDHLNVEWRFSPSCIERLLMFSLESVHLKCYVFLKMIKKSLFSRVVGDGLTSFHCKTVLFYTIEENAPDIWTEDNLFTCVSLCLKKLRTFLLNGFCPHYIIEEANLFTGKLSRTEQHKLCSYIDTMIEYDVSLVFSVACDNVGERIAVKIANRINNAVNNNLIGKCANETYMKWMVTYSYARGVSGGFRIHLILFAMKIYPDEPHPIRRHPDLSPESVLKKWEILLQRLSEYLNNGTDTEKEIAPIIRRYIYNTIASLQSSIDISRGDQVSDEIMEMFQLSVDSEVAAFLHVLRNKEGEDQRAAPAREVFDTDMPAIDGASATLKVASAQFCQGKYDVTAKVLEYMEHRCKYQMPVCGCGEKENRPWKSSNAARNFPNLHKAAYCVMYMRHEIHCVPWILQWEMIRDIGDDIYYRGYLQTLWMDMAITLIYDAYSQTIHKTMALTVSSF